MHSEIVQDKQGEFAKYDMNLIFKEVKKNTYTCPVHPKINMDKPSNFPDCGINLVLKEKKIKKES